MPVELSTINQRTIQSQSISYARAPNRSHGMADMRSSLCSKSAKKESGCDCLKMIANFFRSILNCLFCGLCGKKKADSKTTAISARHKKNSPEKEALLKQAGEFLTDMLLTKAVFEKLPERGAFLGCIVKNDGKDVPELDEGLLYFVHADHQEGQYSVKSCSKDILLKIRAFLDTAQVRPSTTLNINLTLICPMEQNQTVVAHFAAKVKANETRYKLSSILVAEKLTDMQAKAAKMLEDLRQRGVRVETPERRADQV